MEMGMGMGMGMEMEMDESIIEEGHDEAILISRNGYKFDIALTTASTIIDTDTDTTTTTTNRHLKTPTPPPRHPIDAMLLSIMNKYNLDSLSISISSSSETPSFPVGTAVQFTSSHANANANANANDNANDGIEYNLMRILSSKNLLCERVQLEPLHSGKIKAVQLNHNNNHGGSSSSSKIVMLPNDAFSLCHSSALMEQIISSSPCRGFSGVYSKLQADLNEFDIVDRATWVNVTVERLALVEGGQGQGQGQGQAARTITRIEKGLRFGRLVSSATRNQQQVQVNLATLLGTGTGTGTGAGTNGQGDLIHQCPLMKSSNIIVRNGNETVKHDLKSAAMDMQQGMSFEQSHSSSKLGIQRNNERLNGMANEGMLQTRVYYRGGGGDGAGAGAGTCSDDDDDTSSIDVSLVDVYPHIVSPIYHTMRIMLVQGIGAGDGKILL